jgi:hypothetical protein
VTKPKAPVVVLTVNGKPAIFLGTVPGYVVVQIGTARPICLSPAEFAAKAGG